MAAFFFTRYPHRMHPSWFSLIPESLQPQGELLLDQSPLFVSLMRDADESSCRALFQPLEHAILPQNSAAWFPLCESDNIDTCMSHLRHLKRQSMRHIIWWELGLHGDMESSYHAITQMAEALLQQAIEMAMRLIAPRFGRLKKGAFCIIGLGKLGGHELNLGSDVDPLFIWQADGQTDGGRSRIQANEYYNHLSRMIIRLMSEWTKHGMVWPVDMRLRPGGDGAPICLSLQATLAHYLDYGQTWERAMLIKARPVAGDQQLGEAWIEGIRPFVYRRYLDYSSVTALADMKQRIDQQAGNRPIGEGFDVKRGCGGIREIEFTIQSMQLLHGGRAPSLRTSEGKKALDILQQESFVSAEVAKRLFTAYLFWRRIEHALQARKGEQTHALPADYTHYLSNILHLHDPHAAMQEQSDIVHHIFSQHVLPMNARETASQSWLSTQPSFSTDYLHHPEHDAFARELQQIQQQLLRGLLPERSHHQLDTILHIAMPHWLHDANGVQALGAFANLLHTIAGRATWIDLLATHRGTLQWLIGALSASRYIAEQIVKNPSLLEWPLSSEQHHIETDRLCEQIHRLDGKDEGDFLAALSYTIEQARMHCALAVDAHTVTPDIMGGWLADIADAAVQACLRSSLHQLKLPAHFPLLALALGKHGSREMGLVSDLDMVFVIAGDANQQVNGRSMREWAQRLGRRMIRQLSDLPPFGAGYEFDARLRPSGNSGVLVTTLAGFQDYQLHEAQTWEHQALCRGRVITGSAHDQQQLNRMIQQIITMPRDISTLIQDVRDMRSKMLNHLASKERSIINLKHDQGGLVDIEFLAQFARLAWGGEHQGTIQGLLHLSEKAPDIWQKSAPWLAATYLDYRQMENALRVELWQSIGKLPHDVNASEWETMRRHAPIQSPQALLQRMQETHAMFDALLDPAA